MPETIVLCVIIGQSTAILDRTPTERASHRIRARTVTSGKLTEHPSLGRHRTMLSHLEAQSRIMVIVDLSSKIPITAG
jgi:hypothetical protein